MKIHSILYVLGKILFMEAILMLMPLLLAVVFGENTVLPYAATCALLFLLGGCSFFFRKKEHPIRAREALAITGLTWIAVSFFAALPFFFSGEIPNLLDAMFETVSGFTTTGATVLSDIEALSLSSLFWRSFSHWIGGMGVLVFVLAILPGNDTQSMYLMRAEVPGPQVGKLVSKLRLTARLLYIIYMALTLLEMLLLLLGGMPLFDAAVTSFSTAGTGGFAIKNASILAYNSAYIDGVITVFMLIFSLNFTLYYLLLLGNFRALIKSEELRWFGGIVLAATVAVTLNVLPLYGGIGKAFRYAVFTVSSIISTTGFITADFALWPAFSQAVLVLLMFIGACAGSTGGGIKISRIAVICKTAVNNIRRQLSPRSVVPLKYEGKLLDKNTESGITGYLYTFLVIASASTLLLSLDNLNFTEAFSAMAACLNNVGPGLGKVGPTGNFGGLSALSKCVLIFDMLAGRLELFPILALFSPSAWRNR